VNATAPFEPVQKVQRRVEWLIAGFGLVGTVFVAMRWNARSAAGFALGAALSWLNYRWLKQGVTTIVPSSTSAAAPSSGGEAPQESPPAHSKVPKKVIAKFFGRYVLLLAALYAILSYSLLPAAAFLAGLFAMVAAVLAELLYELMWHKW